MNNKEFKKFNDFIEMQNKMVYPARLQRSTFLKELAFRYIDNWEKENR